MTPARTALRPIAAMAFPDVLPAPDIAGEPRFSSADPRTLLVDETYQRNLSERSIALIRRVVAGWDWKAFKPPVCVETPDGLHVLDGQHTAIAAATHPAIAEIPIMIVTAATVADRASAFVKHNRDRIAVTPLQLHAALVKAGDEDAQTIAQVCIKAGVHLLAMPPYQGRYAVGDTMSVSAIRGLIQRRHAKGAREVLQVCVEGLMAPVTSSAIKAVETILFSSEYAGQVAREDLALTIRKLGEQAERQAKMYSAEHRVPIWRGLVITLFRNTPKVRRGQRAAA